MVHITKLYHTTDAQSFRAFGRVMSGVLTKGMDVKVLGEGYSPEDEEDMLKAVIEDIWISESRSVSTSCFEYLPMTVLFLLEGTSFPLMRFQQEISFFSEELMPQSQKPLPSPLHPSTMTCTSSGLLNT